MSDNVINRVAWQPAPGERLQLGSTDLQQPGPHEILVRNAAIAINPLDWLLQDAPILPWLHYPAILGSDVAGEIVAIGDRVDRFKVGDRVLGQAVGTTVDAPAQGAFQHHTIVLEHMAAPIPDGMAFAEAVVLPLGLGTAASGLYGKRQLALAAPSHSIIAREELVIIWGGSSSVGCNAIQLAVASGYPVLATASPRNADLLKSLGASMVLNHASASVVADVVAAVQGRPLAGTLHATGDMAACFAVVSQCEGERLVATSLAPPADMPAGVEARHIFGTSLKDDEVGPMIYRDFLPHALASGSFVPAPPPMIVGHGLKALQTALETLKSGVSGAKVVVSLN